MESLSIVIALLRFGLRIIPKGWWKKYPFLPLPSNEYMKLRLKTMYGSYKPTWKELIVDTWHFGRWLKQMERYGKKK